MEKLTHNHCFSMILIMDNDIYTHTMHVRVTNWIPDYFDCIPIAMYSTVVTCVHTSYSFECVAPSARQIERAVLPNNRRNIYQ